MHAESLLTNFLRESGQQIGFCVCTYELERCGARRKFFAKLSFKKAEVRRTQKVLCSV